MTSRLRQRAAFLLAAGLLCGAAVIATASPASAHDFSGGGDCDSWTVQLDGTFGAHTIFIDGVAQPTVKTIYVISDGSDDESRTFTVKWDKDRNDVTKTHTLKRDTDGCELPTTTTTVPPTTTTTESPPATLVPPTTVDRLTPTGRPAVPEPVEPTYTG